MPITHLTFVWYFLFSWALLCLSLPSFAESETPSVSTHALAFMAPVDRWAVRLELRRNGWDKQFNNRGDLEDMDAVFDQTVLNSSLLPALVVMGSGASLGTTAFNTRIENSYSELAFAYGVSDDLTVGVLLPFAQTRSRVDFSVSGGNVGFNSAFDPSQAIGPSNYPFAPVGAGASQPVGTDGVQQILTDPAFGYGYKTIESTTTSGFSDPTLGLLWRFYKSRSDSFVLGFGVRFGTADGDDPDNLVDVPVGDGSTDLRAQLEYFRDLGNQFDLRLLLDRKVQTKDRVTMRIPAPGQLLATADSKEKIDRDLGDFWEYDVELGRSWGDWRTSLTWHRYVKAGDRYRSDIGTDTRALEANTRVFANQWRVGLSWSGIQAWQENKLPLPLIIKLEMQETYQGRNFMGVRDYYVRITSFF